MDHLPGEQIHNFHGGLRLRHHKKISCHDPIARLPMPERLLIAVNQHAGAAATPLVKPGYRVLKGQLLAEAPGVPGARVHAPTSGSIAAVLDAPVPHPLGLSEPVIVLETDGKDESVDTNPIWDFRQLTPDALLERINHAGITGLGGAVFPTAIKVNAARDAGIHTLVLNGSECEPYISCDEMLMREDPQRIIQGAQILHHVLGTKRVIFYIEDQMGAVQQALETAIEDLKASVVRLARVTTIYPEGGERQLVQVLTGKQVPSGGFPTDVGILVQNVGTVAAVADAVLDDMPLIQRVVTVSGEGVNHPRNLRVLLGTPMGHLIRHCGGYHKGAARMVMGGPLMGIPLQGDNLPVTKACNCILVLTEDDIKPPQPEMPCINCGECVRVCPAQLLPQQLHWYIRAKEFDKVEKLNLSDCIECGCCDVVCPSHIPLVEYYRFGKDELRKRDQEREDADSARKRFESRELRLEQVKIEQRLRREQKKKAIGDNATRQANIDAAVARSKARKLQQEPGIE
jgi:electron transport complex protein RnfC